MPAILHLSRDSARDTRYRGIYVSLDGIEIGRLNHSDRMTIDLIPGHHVVRVTNTWATKYVRLDVEEDSEFALQVGSLPVPMMWLMMAILNTSPMKVFANLVRIDGLGIPVGDPQRTPVK